MFMIPSGEPGIDISIFVLFGLGAMVGVLGGFFGVGGGWIITPTLHILGMPMPYAVGTGLAYIMGMSLISVSKHRSANSVDSVLGIALGTTMIAGMLAGKSAVIRLEAAGVADPLIRALYIVLLFAIGLFMLRDGLRAPRGGGRDGAKGAVRERGALCRRFRMRPSVNLKKSGVTVSIWPLAVIGVVIGFFSGLLGAGGGFLLVPAMFYLIGTPTIVAVGTSLLCILLASPFGVAAYALEGRVNFPAAAVMLSGVLLAAPLGVRAAHAVRGAHLRFLYAVMVLCGGFSVVLKELDERLESVLLEYASKILIFAAGGGIVFVILLLWFLKSRKPDEPAGAAPDSLD